MTVIDKEGIQSALGRMGVRPSKGRGQNFLASTNALSEVLQFASVRKDEFVVEIGPGLGVLSADLIITAGRYVAVEIEQRFAANLLRQLPALKPEQVICADILSLTVPQIAQLSVAQAETQAGAGAVPSGGITIVSNLPYSISSEVVEWIVKERSSIRRASLLLQREFAERIAAEPGSRAFGSLSVFCQVFASCELGPVIEGDSFFPEAEVESRLVEIKIRQKPLVTENQDNFFGFVRSAFAKKRKTVLNNLTVSGQFGSKPETESVLREAGIEPSLRAEAMEISQFVKLFQLLESRRR